jgi:hypothetical protein
MAVGGLHRGNDDAAMYHYLLRNLLLTIIITGQYACYEEIGSRYGDAITSSAL